MKYSAFYPVHLNEVSRSFSFCIARLNAPLKEWIGLSYLLFRVLDTIEDAVWADLNLKKETFKNFESALQLRKLNPIEFEWLQHFPTNIPEVEKNLLRVVPQLMNDFKELPDFIQNSLKKSLLMMSQGMQHFSDLSTSENKLELKSLKEVNQYCFFVAGLVGEMLTHFISSVLPKSSITPELYFNSHQFGLFLQKINLLKDQIEDQAEGRFLVPNRPELLKSLKTNSKGAINYILQVPVSEKEFRLFCAWSLFLGLSSLPWIENTFLKKLVNKIPRSVTQILLNQVEAIIDDNQALIQLFNETTRSLAESIEPEATFDSTELHPNWLTEIYQGQLKLPELSRLGVL